MKFWNICICTRVLQQGQKREIALKQIFLACSKSALIMASRHGCNKIIVSIPIKKLNIIIYVGSSLGIERGSMFQNVNVSTRWFWTVRTNVSRSSYYYISNRLDDQVVEGALTPICMNRSLSDSGSLERPFFLFAIWTSCMHKCIYIGYL